MCEKVSTLEELKEKFLLVKQSQHTGELAMRNDRNCLADFLKTLDRKNYTYTGMRDYAIIALMLDTGIRTREPLNLHNSDFDAKAGCIATENQNGLFKCDNGSPDCRLSGNQAAGVGRLAFSQL